MASFKAKFPVLQELFAKNHRGALWARPAGRGLSIFLSLDDTGVTRLKLCCIA